MISDERRAEMRKMRRMDGRRRRTEGSSIGYSTLLLRLESFSHQWRYATAIIIIIIYRIERRWCRCGEE